MTVQGRECWKPNWDEEDAEEEDEDEADDDGLLF